MSLEIRKLWKLHEIDQAILEIRKQAANLDPARVINKEIAALQAQIDEIGGNYKDLHAEQTDLDLKRKGWEDKIKKHESELYSGKIVNSREVETMQKEVLNLKRQVNDTDDRLLELMEIVPVAKKPVEEILKQIENKKADLVVKNKEALKQRGQLEADFKEVAAKRAPLAKEVSPALLSKYEALRQKHAGIGMVMAIKGNCSACGTTLPAKTIEGAKLGRVVTCEACHRLVYATDGLV